MPWIRRGTISAADIITDAVVAAERFDDYQIPADLRARIRGPCFGHTGMMATARSIFADMEARGMLTALVGSRERAAACQAPRGQGPPSRTAMHDRDAGEGPGELGAARAVADTAAMVGGGLADTAAVVGGGLVDTAAAVGTAVGVTGQALWNRIPGTTPVRPAQATELNVSPEQGDADALYAPAAHQDIEAPLPRTGQAHGKWRGAGRGMSKREGDQPVGGSCTSQA